MPRYGFTLVELLIAMALGIFLIGGLIVTLLAGKGAAIEAERLSRMQENIRFASDYMIRDIRNAAFRDQLTLTFDQFGEIGRRYAEYGDDDGSADQTQLIVRYAGRGACGDAFSSASQLKLIENRYFVEAGNLRCQGTEKVFDSATSSTTESTETVTLASGLTGLGFQFIRPTGTTVADDSFCTFADEADLASACIGVRIRLFFEDEEQDRVAELNASFRNVILDQLYGRD